MSLLLFYDNINRFAQNYPYYLGKTWSLYLKMFGRGEDSRCNFCFGI